MKRNLRDHGLPDPQGVLGIPTWRELPPTTPGCPHCGTVVVCVEVHVQMDMLKGGVGRGSYLGCPACSWAGPMWTVADASHVPHPVDMGAITPPGARPAARATWRVLDDGGSCPKCGAAVVEVTPVTGAAHSGCPACPWPNRTRMPTKH